MELTSIILALTTVGAAVWGVLTRWDLLYYVNTRNDQLNAILLQHGIRHSLLIATSGSMLMEFSP